MRIEKPGQRVEIASLYLPDCKRGVAVWKETRVIKPPPLAIISCRPRTVEFFSVALLMPLYSV